MSRRQRQQQHRALTEYQQGRRTPEESSMSERRPSSAPASTPGHLGEVEYVSLRLLEAVLRKEGAAALTMEVAADAVAAAQTLLKRARG